MKLTWTDSLNFPPCARAVEANVDRAINQILDLWWMANDQSTGEVVDRIWKKEVMREIILAHLGCGGCVLNTTPTA